MSPDKSTEHKTQGFEMYLSGIKGYYAYFIPSFSLPSSKESFYNLLLFNKFGIINIEEPFDHLIKVFIENQLIMKINLNRVIIFFVASLLLITNGCATKEKNSNTDGVITIGTQKWMSENLDVITFRNGDIIPEAKTDEEWKLAGENGKPAWCYLINDTANNKFGKLYNWYAVNDPRGLAPEGWHVPTDTEWTNLIDFLGGGEVAGSKMKATTGWKENGNGTNESAFSGLPGGSRGRDGAFDSNSGGGTIGGWWSSTETYTDYAWTRYLSFTVRYAYKDYYYKELGFSVRCLKD